MRGPELRIALSPLTTVTRMLIDAGGRFDMPGREGAHVADWLSLWDLEAQVLPDFLLPVPGRPRSTLRDELAEVAATPPRTIRAQLAVDYPEGNVPESLRRFARTPRSSVQEYARAVHAWSRHAMAPHARAVGACLNMELIRVAKLIATEGTGAALAGLHPDVAFADGGLRWTHDDGAWNRRLDQPLLLLPVFTRAPNVLMRFESGQPVALAYGAAGVAAPLERLGSPDARLAGLLGPTRAQILLRLPEAATTTQLATSLGYAASTVSEHLRALEKLGLVTRGRSGHYVLYGRTERARQLLALF